MALDHPIADKFKSGVYEKPTYDKREFYVGGVMGMMRRLKAGLAPFSGAYEEFLSRTEGTNTVEVVAAMWDYVKLT